MWGISGVLWGYLEYQRDTQYCGGYHDARGGYHENHGGKNLLLFEYPMALNIPQYS